MCFFVRLTKSKREKSVFEATNITIKVSVYTTYFVESPKYWKTEDFLDQIKIDGIK